MSTPRYEKSPKWVEFPEPVREVFGKLWDDVASLHFKWRTYLELYDGDDSVAVLDQTARGCFNFIAECMANDMTMAFARLTDPALTCGKQNLSLDHLLDSLARHVEPDLLSRWRSASRAFWGRCDSFRQLRNKAIGHRDLGAAIRREENPLPGISRPYVEDALASLRDFMNGIELHFRRGGTYFEGPEMHGNGKHLLFYLRKGIQACREEGDRLRGKSTG